MGNEDCRGVIRNRHRARSGPTNWAFAILAVALGCSQSRPVATASPEQAPTQIARPDWPPETSGPLEPEQFVRVVYHRRSKEDPGRHTVQTSVRELRHPETGCSVVLLAMTHVAEESYFRSLEPLLQRADVVLSEGGAGRSPGAPRLDFERLPKYGQVIRRYQDLLARLLGLAQQHDWEARVADSRWHSADMAQEPLLAHVEKLGSGPKSMQQTVARWERLVVGSSAELAKGKEEAVRRLFGQSWSPQFEEGNMRELSSLRERIMFNKLQQAVEAGKHKRIACVLGAEHQYFLEPRITAELGFRHFATSWHEAVVHELPAKEPASED